MGLKLGLFEALKRRNAKTRRDEGYTLYRYVDEKGEFDYEAYRQAQIEANKKKIGAVWVQEENIAFLSDYIRHRIPNPQFGICHGTRRGCEQQWFRERLGCEVIGTEISDTAHQFPHTIQWDFHETKPEWISAVDFIYSNSFDHSYDPKKCLNAWMSCLRPDGLLIIEHSADDVNSKKSDPFGAHLQILPWLILEWGAGRFSCREIIRAPNKSRFGDKEYDTFFLVIENNVKVIRDKKIQSRKKCPA